MSLFNWSPKKEEQTNGTDLGNFFKRTQSLFCLADCLCGHSHVPVDFWLFFRHDFGLWQRRSNDALPLWQYVGDLAADHPPLFDAALCRGAKEQDLGVADDLSNH